MPETSIGPIMCVNHYKRTAFVIDTYRADSKEITRRDTMLESVRDKLTQTVWFGTTPGSFFPRKRLPNQIKQTRLIPNSEERSYMGIAGIELQRY